MKNWLFTDKELAKLDTLKTEYNRFLASSKITTTYYSNDVDPSTVYKQSNDLINEKGTIVYWLSTNSKPVQVIDEFKSPVSPQSYSLIKSLSFCALIGLGICFLLGLYLELTGKSGIIKGTYSVYKSGLESILEKILTIQTTFIPACR